MTCAWAAQVPQGVVFHRWHAAWHSTLCRVPAGAGALQSPRCWYGPARGQLWGEHGHCLQENVALIKEINELRREVKTLKHTASSGTGTGAGRKGAEGGPRRMSKDAQAAAGWVLWYQGQDKQRLQPCSKTAELAVPC